MAVVRTEEVPGGTRFELKTVDDRPALLEVRRTGDQRVYEATATVGRFQDDPQRAAALIRALDQRMLAYGGKRGFYELEQVAPQDSLVP